MATISLVVDIFLPHAGFLLLSQYGVVWVIVSRGGHIRSDRNKGKLGDHLSSKDSNRWRCGDAPNVG